MRSNHSVVRPAGVLVAALGCQLAFVPRASAQHAEGNEAPEAPEEPPTEFPGVVSGGVVATARGPSRDFDSPPPREPAVQRQFALLAVALAYDGFGLGVRALGPRFGLDLSAAYHPILATLSTEAGKVPKIALLSSYQINAAFYLGLYRPNVRTDLGLTVGYKYNTLVQHGVAAAFYLQRELSDHFAFQFFVGPAVFPRAEREIRKEKGWVKGSVSSGLAWQQGGVGISFTFYP